MNKEEKQRKQVAKEWWKERAAKLEKDKACKQKIIDLQKENEKLRAELEENRDLPAIAYQQGAEWQKRKDEVRLAELEQQIEKMKCCSNCKHFNKEDDLECCQNCERQLVNSLDNLKAEEIIKDEWEIKEND